MDKSDWVITAVIVLVILCLWNGCVNLTNKKCFEQTQNSMCIK